MTEPHALDYHKPKSNRMGGTILKALAIVVGSIMAIALLGFMLLVWSISGPSRVTFHITNNTPAQIDSVVFTSPRGDEEIGPIPPGQTRDIRVKTTYGFDYKYVAKANGRVVSGVAARWGDEDDEGRTANQDMRIDPTSDGAIEVGRAFGRH